MNHNDRRIVFITNSLNRLFNRTFFINLQQAFQDFDFAVLDIQKALLRKPVTVTINCLSTFRHYGFKAFRSKNTFAHYFFYTPFMFRTIKRLSRDFVRRNPCTFTIQLLAQFDGSVTGTPHFVYTDHTYLVNLTYPGYDSKKLACRAWIELEHQIYENAKLVFVFGSQTARSLREQYLVPGNKVRIAGFGPNISGYGRRFTARKHSDRIILFAGRDWERKGGPTLVTAFQKVCKEIPQARLVLIGNCPPVEHPNVTVPGMVTAEELKEWYSRATVFCMPTTREPGGQVFLEAMSYKLPIVTTNIGAIPDFVKHGKNGYTVTIGDADSIAHHLVELLSNEARCTAFGEYGIGILKQGYTWKAVTLRIKTSIEDLLRKDAAMRIEKHAESKALAGCTANSLRAESYTSQCP